MNTADFSSIHRHLDDAFAGIAMNPDLQDLKEEIRASLAARVEELSASGMDAAGAATKAIAELGDIHDAIDAVGDGGGSFGGETSGGGAKVAPESSASLIARNHLKPKPGFVVRAVILSLIVVAGVVLVLLGGLSVLDWPLAALIVVAILVVAAPIGLLVFDGTHQETSQSYPLPIARSAGFGIASIAGALGLALAGLFIGNTSQLWLLVVGILLALASLVAFIWLGITQTNRRKPWALELQRSYQIEDRFSQDPVAAARFGLYTVVIWVLAFALFGVLSLTVGFAWSWIALVVGLVVFMLTLARMLFPPDKTS
jgi:hypothetical protein